MLDLLHAVIEWDSGQGVCVANAVTESLFPAILDWKAEALDRLAQLKAISSETACSSYVSIPQIVLK